MDPDSGREPHDGGASAAERGVGKPPRRRKGKRGGKNRNATSNPHASPASTAGQAARLETKQDQPARKRKRRRSRPDRASAQQPVNDTLSVTLGRPHGDGRGGASHPAALADAAGQAGGPGASPGGGPKGRDRRKKSRGGRGLQGRPLAQAKGAPTKGVAVKGVPAKGGLVKGALDGVSQPALARAISAQPVERVAGHAAGLQAIEASLAFQDDLYAALDLGTNNCRLLIAQPTRPGHFRVVDAFSRIVRLGEGLAANRRLSADAMDRAVEALRVCAAKLATKPIRRMRLIATEACRAADNGEEFLARVTAETGLQLEIIDRETEARLAVSGCSSLVGREARSIVLFDIGGGSSEIAVIRIGDNRSSRLANHITHWTFPSAS
jgi:exopolyphosphatase / guanosine-5'-triphosphate,3'-diphosphate pyrophosphatase